MRLKLTIDRNTFIWVHGSKGLVYNSSNFMSFEFDMSDGIKKVCDKLEILANLYEVSLDESYNQDNSLKEWVDNMLLIHSAKINTFDTDSIPSLKPVLKIQKDMNRIVSERDFTEAINCLKETTIHLNGLNISKKEEEYHKQLIYPIKTSEELDLNQLNSFLKNIPQKSNVKLNFVGCYSSNSSLSKLLDILNNRINTITFYFRIEDVYHLWDFVQIITNTYNINLFCKCTNELSQHINFIKNKISHPFLHFLVTSEEDINFLNSIDKEGIDYTITPLFVGNNKDFFKQYVYLTKEDCCESKVDKRHIFMNQTLNGNFFGKLNILPDGSIWDNPNFSKLGSVKDNFFELLLSVFDSKKSWFYIRNQEPCTHCLYQWICPPPSNYETIIGEANLCHVKL